MKSMLLRAKVLTRILRWGRAIPMKSSSWKYAMKHPERHHSRPTSPDQSSHQLERLREAPTRVKICCAEARRVTVCLLHCPSLCFSSSHKSVKQAPGCIQPIFVVNKSSIRKNPICSAQSHNQLVCVGRNDMLDIDFQPI